MNLRTLTTLQADSRSHISSDRRRPRATTSTQCHRRPAEMEIERYTAAVCSLMLITVLAVAAVAGPPVCRTLRTAVNSQFTTPRNTSSFIVRQQARK
jgi:hypothetical protein